MADIVFISQEVQISFHSDHTLSDQKNTQCTAIEGMALEREQKNKRNAEQKRILHMRPNTKWAKFPYKEKSL